MVILERGKPIARLVPFEPRQSDLVITPAKCKVSDLPPPRPIGRGGDIPETLAEERADRF